MKNLLKILTTVYFLSLLFWISVCILFACYYPHAFMKIICFAVLILAILAAIVGLILAARAMAVLTLKMLPQKKLDNVIMSKGL